MKKYFLKSSNEELKFGDMIELDMTADLPDGRVKHRHLECEFIPQLVDLLHKEGIIVIQETKEPEVSISDKKQLSGILQEIISTQEDLELRVDKLEELVLGLKMMIKSKNSPKSNAQNKKA